ncbi:MAG: site-2 protease family protein [Candidatus Hydrogenedentes bacterium]|nr:site-2 protease family protein [Candidatus Hydrogenedentota bacterium]
MEILIFVLVLSVLIFVHELGHFAAAKACNIYVDQFSIGMPPRVLGYKYGETDYCIGALPIGGYVKMAGQEDAPLSEEERDKTYGHVPPSRWFNNKPVWQRVIVLVAGPAMNLFFAVFLYGLIAALGEEVPEFELDARIGVVDPESPAAKAPLYREAPGQDAAGYTGAPEATGWKAGDLIVSIDGKPVGNIRALAMEAVLNGAGTPHLLVIERPQDDGTAVRYASIAAPELAKDGQDYPRFGVGPFQTAVVGEVMPGMPGEAAGLKPDDIIERADGTLMSWDTFVKLMEDYPEGQPVQLSVRRGDEKLALSIVPNSIGRIKDVDIRGPEDATKAELETATPEIAMITEELSKTLNLKRRDKIVSVNGEKVSVARFQDIVRDAAGKELALEVERPAVMFGLLQGAENFSAKLTVDTVRAIGISTKLLTVHQNLPAWQIVPEAMRRTSESVTQILLTLKALAVQNVSVKDLGGPVMIAQATMQAAEGGLGLLLSMTAYISINLCIFNLLPLPVLDGGQLVLNGLEAVRRKPLSPMILERIQQAGVVFILALMLFVTYNDIGRWIENITP